MALIPFKIPVNIVILSSEHKNGQLMSYLQVGNSRSYLKHGGNTDLLFR